MLEALGLSEFDEQVYVALLGRPHMAASEVAEELGRGVGVVRTAVTRLEELGFVARLPGSPTRLTATRPEVAVGALIARRTEELSDAAQAAQQLSASFPKEVRARPDELVEIIVGRPAVAARFVQLTRTVQVDLLVLDRPPYAQNAAASNSSEIDVLSKGVTVRGIYAPEAFELEGAYDQAVAASRAGEEARVHGDVPMKLAIADRSEALLPLDADGVVDSVLVMRAPTSSRRWCGCSSCCGPRPGRCPSGTAALHRTPPTRSTTSCSPCSRRGSRTRRSPAASASASAPWADGSGDCSTRSGPGPVSRPASRRAAPGCAADVEVLQIRSHCGQELT